MRSRNVAIVAAAGGGKTTRIVSQCLANKHERSALITFTQNNTEQLEQKIYTANGVIPGHIEVWSWYSFLIKELARPFQNYMYEPRIDGLNWVTGRSDIYAKKEQVGRFYFGNCNLVYSDKLSQFVCACNEVSNGAVIRRLEQRFQHIYIDEIQDLAGYDIDLLELILQSKIKLTIVGDHRQSTYKTNQGRRNASFSGLCIIKKFEEWQRKKLLELTFDTESYRCNQPIADLADTLFPDIPATKSMNSVITGHDGVFTVSTAGVASYYEQFRPQVLRLDKKTNCHSYAAMNMGESKGLTFNRVLIFPHKLGQKWLKTGERKHIAGSISKIYVGITRARYSVAFVIDDSTKLRGAVRYV